MSKNKSNFLIQGSILALAGILVRVIGLIYRIPLNNILGNEGIGYYSNAYSVYSIFLLISSTSLPVAVSKIVSTRVAKGQFKNAKRAFTGALIFSFIVGGLCSAIVFFGADFFASLWKYPSMALALRVLAPTIFIVCVLGVLRGYFQGLGTMIPTAMSQIIEQIINAIVSIVAAAFLFSVGDKVGKGAAYSAAGGTTGTLVGAAFALLFMIFVYGVYKPVMNKRIKRDKSIVYENHSALTKVLFVTIVPVLLSTTIYNLSSIIDSGLFGNVMSNIFKLDESTYSSLYGIYSGKYQLLTTAPIAVASALSSAIIPSLIRSLTTGNKGELINKIESSVRLSMIIAIPCGVGISALAEPICILLFLGSEMLDICVGLMRFAVVTVVAYSFSTITNSILQGIDKMSKPVINSSISLAIHIVLVLVLLIVFKMDILGIVVADFVFALLVCILNTLSIRKYLGYRQEIYKTFFIPAVSSILMAVAAMLVYKGIYILFRSNLIALAVSIIIAMVVYGILLIGLKAIDESEIYMLPKGSAIARLLKKLHLL